MVGKGEEWGGRADRGRGGVGKLWGTGEAGGGRDRVEEGEEVRKGVE